MTAVSELLQVEADNLKLYNDQLYSLRYEDVINLIFNIIKKDINKKKASKTEKKRWNILNEKYRDAFLSNKRLHLFKTCTGSGKSVTSMLWAKYLTSLSYEIEGFVALSSEYENGTDEIERIIQNHGTNVDYIRFEGKNRLCINLEKEINDKGTKIGDLINSGISISNYCEEQCEHYTSCKYYYNCQTLLEENGIKNWIGVQHQLNAFLPIYLMKTYGDVVLIIDEDFSDAIKVSCQYKVPVLRKNLAFLKKIYKILKNKPLTDDSFKLFVKKFILVLEHFLENLYTFLTPLDYSYLLNLFDDIDILKGVDDYFLEKLNDYAFALIENGTIKPFPFIFPQLCNFIDNYFNENPIDHETEASEWVKSAFYKNQKNFTISFLYYDKFLLETVLRKENLFKIIINDATAEPEILSYILGDIEEVVEHNEDWLYERCTFHQLKKKINNHVDPDRNYAHYPKSSLQHSTTFNYLMDDLKVIFNNHPNERILIVSRDIDGDSLSFNGGIKLSDYVKTLGHPEIIFEDYPLAGTNIYSDINIIVLLGKPDLPTAVLKRQSTLIGMEQQHYRELYSRNLMKQAMGRIFRGYKHKTVYILSGFDLLFDRPIIVYKSHSDLREKLKEVIKKRRKTKESNDLVKIILEHVKKHKFITVKDCIDMNILSKYKARNFLDLLVNKGILKLGVSKYSKRVYCIV